ncbi:uncharacterized protein TM35_000351240 [Trypanosoma theileri]|uniref:Transcription factor 25-like n=1 Tax=Trypanosoma theileri TaxID=67003 RepID=A0A1X0NMM7_9TRYP|nr:uncharacterized protein TM35_000351240 [Trypanosoma theileri]ORC85380.1 hypothetical protein TM35_000351240 [Trypanosoma theileri]
MSARQLRRLQNLVKASTGADADDDTAEFPSTMQLPKNGGRSKGQRRKMNQEVLEQKQEKKHQQEGDEKEKKQQEHHEEQPVITKTPKYEVRAERTPDVEHSSVQHPTSSTKECSLTEPKAVGGTSTSTTPAAAGRRRGQRSRRRGRAAEEEAEEERLLAAVLRQRELEAGRSGQDNSTLTADRHGDEAVGETADLLTLLSVCNPKMLDSRLERIRRFGREAVEDIGDGRVPQRRPENRPSSLFYTENMIPTVRFRHSILATPNRYSWPPYDGLGAVLVVKEKKQRKTSKNDLSGKNGSETCSGGSSSSNGNNGSVVYYLDTSNPDMHRADAALAMCEFNNRGIEGLLECLSVSPYHVPTLILTSNVFEMMGNVPKAQDAIDIALYHVGVLFSRFPLQQTVRQRCLPFAITSNKQVFQILRCGVHQSLKKAATQTAWEIAKLLYSLDDTDPFGMLLLLDYLALRRKGWGWLLQVYFIIMHELQKNTTGDSNEMTDSLSNHSLALSLSTLPGFFFSAALAKYFLEREQTNVTGTTGEGKKGKVPKVIRDMTPEQLHAFHNTPSAMEMLADAIGRFPSASVLLVEKLGSSSIPSLSEAWQEIVKANEAISSGDESYLHVIQLWVARNVEMWKAAEPAAFLRRVITEDNGVWLKTHSFPASTIAVAASKSDHSSHLTPWQHLLLKEEDVMGQTVSAIPAHLLNSEEYTEEDMRDEMRRMVPEAIASDDHDTLLRFEALYGPLEPPTLSPSERLARYDEMFTTDQQNQRFQEPRVGLWFVLRRFLPSNIVRDMQLRSALQENGVPDPVVQQDHWGTDEEEGDEDSFSTEGSWFTDETIVTDEDDDEEEEENI